MKFSHQILTFLVLITPLIVAGQQSEIDAALQKGNATALGKYFSKSVELSLPALEGTFPAERAVAQLTDFFNQNTVKTYKRAHLSAPQEGRVGYSIGDLYTVQGTFRTTLYYDAGQKITEVRIQK